jgi:hypothetical protein
MLLMQSRLLNKFITSKRDDLAKMPKLVALAIIYEPVWDSVPCAKPWWQQGKVSEIS